MKKIGAYIIVLAYFLFFHLEVFSQTVLNIGDDQAKKALILQELIGPGVTIVSDITCNCDFLGNFSDNPDNPTFGIDGILLTTGNPEMFINGQSGIGKNGGCNGFDEDIKKMVECSGNGSCSECVQDACVIEFEAIFENDGLAIEYIFASQEYQAYTCSRYNDGFGFFIKEKDIDEDFENIALIPGYNIPVSINTVNLGCSGSNNCDKFPFGKCYEGDYNALFNENHGYLNYPVKVHGFTDLLTAIEPLQKNLIYHVKIVVADVTDGNYDSGVLLKMKGLYSVEIPKISLECNNGEATLKTTKQYDGYKWILKDEEIATSQTIRPQEHGDYSVKVLIDDKWVLSEAFTYNLSNECAESSFYVNDIHNEDLSSSDPFCGKSVRISTQTGYLSPLYTLKWYIDGVEETEAYNKDAWNRDFAPGVYKIEMEISILGLSKRVEARLTVKPCEDTPECAECPSSFAPTPGGKYVLSAWVKEVNTTSDPVFTYEKGLIELSFEGSSGAPVRCIAEGSIIEGWQRIQREFTVPQDAVKIKIDLVNEGPVGDVFFDDIRIFPFNGNMKSYVYDPVTMRLTAELDNENYATFYEYDEEGALIRVKKETERGIMTLREARQSRPKNK